MGARCEQFATGTSVRSGQALTVRLRVAFHDTRWGETLGVVGCDEMGQWCAPIPLSGVRFPEWTVELERLKPGKKYEYKYVVIANDGNIVRWEGLANDSNRSFVAERDIAVDDGVFGEQRSVEPVALVREDPCSDVQNKDPERPTDKMLMTEQQSLSDNISQHQRQTNALVAPANERPTDAGAVAGKITVGDEASAATQENRAPTMLPDTGRLEMEQVAEVVEPAGEDSEEEQEGIELETSTHKATKDSNVHPTKVDSTGALSTLSTCSSREGNARGSDGNSGDRSRHNTGLFDQENSTCAVYAHAAQDDKCRIPDRGDGDTRGASQGGHRADRRQAAGPMVQDDIADTVEHGRQTRTKVGDAGLDSLHALYDEEGNTGGKKPCGLLDRDARMRGDVDQTDFCTEAMELLGREENEASNLVDVADVLDRELRIATIVVEESHRRVMDVRRRGRVSDASKQEHTPQSTCNQILLRNGKQEVPSVLTNGSFSSPLLLRNGRTSTGDSFDGHKSDIYDAIRAAVKDATMSVEEVRDLLRDAHKRVRTRVFKSRPMLYGRRCALSAILSAVGASLVVVVAGVSLTLLLSAGPGQVSVNYVPI